MDNYEKERDELLKSFANALREVKDDGHDKPWFDEDQLLDIFDFAGDVGNDYLRAEALMWGARFFPDSERLHERRAVFYADVLSDNDLSQFSQANEQSQSFLTRLISLRSQNLKPGETLEQLKNMVESQEKLDDEEAIQLVNCAVDTNNFQWVVDNLEKLKKKTQYPPALLYEVAISAMDLEQYQTTVAVMDNLVEENPYSADFWNVLGTAYLYMGNFAGATEAVDMSLAIDPDFEDAVKTKARLLADRTDSESLTILEEFHTRFPENGEIAQQWFERLLNENGEKPLTAELKEELLSLHRQFPENEQFFTWMIIHCPQVAGEAIQDYWKRSNGAQNVREWIKWVNVIAGIQHFRGALAIVRTVLEQPDIPALFQPEFIALESMLCFKLKDWNRALECCLNYNKRTNQTTPELEAVHMISLVKLGKPEQAYLKAREIMNWQILSPSPELPRWLPGYALSFIGLRFLASKLLEMRDAGATTLDFRDYDPLAMWS